MRGMFTVGVLDRFMELGVQVDGIVGVSAGALFGVNFLSGQRGRAIRYNKRYNGDRDYLGLLPLLREGNLVSTEYAYHRVPHELDPFDDEAYRKSGIPYYAVVTDVETGEPVYMRIHSVFEQMEVLRASASMPFVSRPVELNGRRYLDGGISDSVPFQWLAAQGYDRLIVVLTRDLSYRKKPMSPLLIRSFYHGQPALQRRLLQRHDTYNHAIEELKHWEDDGRAIVIRPPQPLTIGRIETNPQRLQEVYEMGLAAGSM